MHQAGSSPHSGEPTRLVLAKTLEIITGKWRLQIIYQLAGKNLSYRALLRSNPGVSQKILRDELNELVSLGFLQKESFQKIRTRGEYSLTEKALGIMPILHQLIQAVEKHLF